jgi:hypothetical protein
MTEMVIGILNKNDTFKLQTTLDCHSPRLKLNDVSFPTHLIFRCYLRGVLGNKCAGHHNLKTVHFREKLASSNFLAWFSGVCVFFCCSLSTLGRRRRAFM